MVNPGICRRCSYCRGIQDSRRDGGVLVHTAMVRCGLGVEDQNYNLLLLSEDPPIGCPYHLEHTLVQKDTAAIVKGWQSEFKESARER